MSKSTSPSPIAFSNYVEPARFGSGYCATVAHQLQGALPRDASPEEKKAVRFIVECAAKVTAVITLRERAGVGKVRPCVLAFANAWSGAAEVLSGLSRVDGPEGDDARSMQQMLFADGVSFVKLDARAAWFGGDRRLRRIDEEDLTGTFEELLGKPLVAQIRSATKALGASIGVGPSQHEVPSSTALAEVVSDFSRAVAAYGRISAARVDESDPASVDRFLKAMAPLDLYRASRKGSTDEAEDDGGGEDVVTDAAPALDAPANGS